MQETHRGRAGPGEAGGRHRINRGGAVTSPLWPAPTTSASYREGRAIGRIIGRNRAARDPTAHAGAR